MVVKGVLSKVVLEAIRSKLANYEITEEEKKFCDSAYFQCV